MALITTTGSWIRQYNAFTGLSAVERSQSGIARAEVVYYNVNDDWPASGAGNNRLYQAGNIELPKDFGYVLTDVNVLVEHPADARIFANAVGQFRIFVGGSLGPQINLTLESTGDRSDDTVTTAIGSLLYDKYNAIYPSQSGENSAIVYSLKEKPSALIYPFASNAYTTTPNPASTWSLSISEQILGGSDYRVTSYVRFLQYDIDQTYNYIIQSPQLTR